MAEIIEYQPSILPLYPFGFLWIVSWKLHSTHWLIMMTFFLITKFRHTHFGPLNSIETIIIMCICPHFC
jgi:hypothetical protein